jgi:hypothetical protein
MLSRKETFEDVKEVTINHGVVTFNVIVLQFSR